MRVCLKLLPNFFIFRSLVNSVLDENRFIQADLSVESLLVSCRALGQFFLPCFFKLLNLFGF